jgi:hypothetical protein
MLDSILASRLRAFRRVGSPRGVRFARALSAVLAALVTASVGPACSVGAASLSGGGDGGSLEASSSDVSEDLAVLDGGLCQPGDVQTYVPTAYHPSTPAYQGVCSAQQLDDFRTACLDAGATAASCYSFSQSPSTAACASCILTPEAAAAYGPLVDHGTFITENVGGCIELTNSSGLTCAKAQQALEGCQLAACQANCPVHDATTRASYDACATTATTSGCQQYQSKAACAQGFQEGGASICVGQTFENFYKLVAPQFCGLPPDAAAPPYDAGRADAGWDAATTDALPPDAPPGEASTGDGPLSDASSADAHADGSSD